MQRQKNLNTIKETWIFR